TPLVRFPCGSTSTRRTRRSPRASEAARLIVVVVLPTPPFWLTTAMILPITICLAMTYVGTTPLISVVRPNMGCASVCSFEPYGEDTRSVLGRQHCSTWNTLQPPKNG